MACDQSSPLHLGRQQRASPLSLSGIYSAPLQAKDKITFTPDCIPAMVTSLCASWLLTMVCGKSKGRKLDIFLSNISAKPKPPSHTMPQPDSPDTEKNMWTV